MGNEYNLVGPRTVYSTQQMLFRLLSVVGNWCNVKSTDPVKHTCSLGCESCIWQSWINDCIAFKEGSCQHKCNRAPSVTRRKKWETTSNQMVIPSRWKRRLVLRIFREVHFTPVFCCSFSCAQKIAGQISMREIIKTLNLWERQKEGKEPTWNISNHWAGARRLDTFTHWWPK